MNSAPKRLALSIKQPWATLVVHGLKSVEIRSWSTGVRGRVYIHTGRIADEREVAWAHLPAQLHAQTALRGGIVGEVDLIECVQYTSRVDFVAERQLHLNEPDWFAPPRVYGFRFARPSPVAFRELPGWFKFFEVEAPVVVTAGISKRKRVIPPGIGSSPR